MFSEETYDSENLRIFIFNNLIFKSRPREMALAYLTGGQ